jgi:hypothetical protein
MYGALCTLPQTAITCVWHYSAANVNEVFIVLSFQLRKESRPSVIKTDLSFFGQQLEFLLSMTLA